MASDAEDVYATVFMLCPLTIQGLVTDELLRPGALVLAHSLKDAGTTKKLAVLVTTDTVSADAMAQLQVSTKTARAH
jgi:glycogenin glucosyltransferase